MKKVKLAKKEVCIRCGHTWIPRKKVIIICPRCKSPYFNIPKKNKRVQYLYI